MSQDILAPWHEGDPSCNISRSEVYYEPDAGTVPRFEGLGLALYYL